MIADNPTAALRSSLRPMTAWAGATVVLFVGAYAIVAFAAGPREAALVALLTMTAWVGMASPLISAAAPSAWAALFRAGIVADAVGLALLALWGAGAADPRETASLRFVTAAKIYCIIAAMTLFGWAAGRIGKTAAGRFISAIAAAVAMGAMLTTPLWTGGLLANLPLAARQQAVAAAVWVNPVYSIASASAEELHFVWHQAPVMYERTRIGDIISPPPVAWWSAAVVQAGLAALAVAVMSCARRRRESPGGVPTGGQTSATPGRDG